MILPLNILDRFLTYFAHIFVHLFFVGTYIIKKKKVFYGQEPPSGEYTTTESGSR